MNFFTKEKVLDLLINYGQISIEVPGKTVTFYRAGHPTIGPSNLYFRGVNNDQWSGAPGEDEAQSLVDEFFDLMVKYPRSTITIKEYMADYITTEITDA